MPKLNEGAEALLVEQSLATARLLIACAEPVKAHRFLTELAPQPAIDHPRVVAFAALLAGQIDQAFSDEAYIERYVGYTNESQNPQEPFTDTGLLVLTRARVALAEIKALAARRPGGVEVLGIGCGDCTLEKVILAENSNVRVHVSELLSVASKATTALESLFPGRVGVAGRFDVGQPAGFERRYDAVTCLEVLEHVADPVRLLTNIRASLNPGGVVILSTPNNANWIEHRHNERFGPGNWYHHLRAYTPRSLSIDFLAAGLVPTIVLEPGGTLIVTAEAGDVSSLKLTDELVKMTDSSAFQAALNQGVGMPACGGTLQSPFLARTTYGTLLVCRGVLLSETE